MCKVSLLYHLLLCLLLISGLPAHSATIYVQSDGDDSRNGFSWASAKKTVKAGLNASASGDEVWVKAGVYIEGITLKTGVGLYGGFAGTENNRSERPKLTLTEDAPSATIIDGYATGWVVKAQNGAKSDTRIDGFVLRNGSSGGGIYCQSSSPTISNCVITKNVSGEGGGIYCESARPSIINCAIVGNVARGLNGFGGGICCAFDSQPVITNCVIADNNAYFGGGIYCSGSTPTITNCTITRNSALNGGGISTSSTLVVTNSIIGLNSSGIYKPGGVCTLRNCCVYNPDGYDFVGVFSNTNVILVDPKLVASEYGQLHIQPSSPCIDAGDDTAVQTGWADMDGQTRWQGAHVDIGADESDGSSWSYAPAIVHVSPAGDDANDGSSWTFAKRTIQAGIDSAARSGGDVWVRAGSYHENVILKSHVFLFGGFVGTESSRSQRDWRANKSVLDGKPDKAVITGMAGYLVTGVDGFTVQNGGMGIDCNGSSPRIVNNEIARNSFSGVYCLVSCSIISNNRITANCDAGIRGWRSGLTIVGNTISANTVSSGRKCGGGISLDRANAVITNNTITMNNAEQGGGVSCSADLGSVIITNNLVAFNSSGIYVSDAVVSLRNNCVFNPEGLNYSGASAGPDDISIDPKLTAVDYGELHLQAGSPCIDAGNDSTVQDNWTDMDGEARKQGLCVDIGSDESDKQTRAYNPITVHVAIWGSDTNDGSSWLTAKRTIQSGIDAAAAVGGEVWVAAGTYCERLSLRPYSYLYGGFAGTEQSKYSRNWHTNISEIDGNGGGNAVNAVAGLKCCSIDGMTVKNASETGIFCTDACRIIANNTIKGNKWGIQVSQYAVALRHLCVISNNTVMNNQLIGINARAVRIFGNTVASNGKRGIYILSGSTVSDNVIKFNSYGGITCEGSSLITRNLITGNSIRGGIYCNGGLPVISDNIISANSAYSGGGICCESSSPMICNNTIVANSGTDGGGVCYYRYYHTGASGTLANNIIAFNSSGICLDGTIGDLVRNNNCLYNPTGSDYIGLSVGEGDITTDPMLVDVENGNYHLSASSPCINAGWNSMVGLPEFDIDGEGRINGSKVDIGADERWRSVTVAVSKGLYDGEVISLRGAIVSAAFLSSFYIQSQDRSAGIRVELQAHMVKPGDIVNVCGVLATDAGERYIAAQYVYCGGSAD